MASHTELGEAPAGSALVGRRDELALLAGALEEARAGQPRVVLVEGPPGIGKTVLVERFLRDARDLTVLRASGDASETDLAFGVLHQLLRRAGESDAAVPSGDGTHVSAGARLLELLGCRADEHPVAIFLDDAHWADLSSLRALLFVVRRLVADPVLVVISTRDDPTVLPEGLRKAAAGPDGLWLRLRPLGTEELHELARAQGVQLSGHALQRLEAHTGGNPLYARALLEELPAEAWDRHDKLPAPRLFVAIVERRVAACSDDAARLLEAAAVLGPHCPLAMAASLAGVDAPLDAVEEATASGLLRWRETAGVPGHEFAHPLIAAALYDRVGPARRARLHTLAAEAVADEGASLRHLAAAATGPDEDLARRIEALAESKAEGNSLEPAASALMTAARLTPDRAEREDRLLRAVDWMLVSGDLAWAQAYADEIAAFAPGPRRSSILGGLAELDGRLEEASRLLATAWEQCDPVADPVLAATIAHRNAYHALRLMRAEDIVTWGRRALALAPTDVLALGWAGTLALGLWRLGRADEAFAVLEQAETGVEDVDAQLRGMRGWLRFAGDDFERAQADLEAAVAGELRLGALLASSVFLTALARLHHATGQWADAVVTAEQATALAVETGHPHVAFACWAAVAVPAARGDWAAADDYCKRAAAGHSDATDRTVAIALTLATVAAARGKPEDVLAILEPVAALSPNPALDEPGFWPWQDLYADALVSVGRTADADVFLGPHERLAAERRRPAAIARLARVRGRLEAALGRRDEAAAAFARALDHIEQVGMPYEEAQIRYAHGQFLRRNVRRRAAADELTRARDILAALGARPALDRCERELVACGLTPAKRGANEQADLTPQEQAVARLVATGRTNREVAAELLLSVKTVEVHLTRIYAKLGISSRAQLAARASHDPLLRAAEE